VHGYTDKCGWADWLKVVSAALLLHLIGFYGILLSAKRGESNQGMGGGEGWVCRCNFIACSGQNYALKTVLFLIESMLAFCFWETRIMDSQVVFLVLAKPVRGGGAITPVPDEVVWEGGVGISWKRGWSVGGSYQSGNRLFWFQSTCFITVKLVLQILHTTEFLTVY